ncbi:MAG: hypothetical protein ACYC8T_13330 [Myxococcaceae bacterium]
MALAVLSLGVSAQAQAQLDSANQKSNVGPAVELFLDHGDVFVRAGTAQGVRVGVVLPVLGPTIGNTTERRTIGSATVLEVWETLARVSLDKAAAAFTGPKLARIAKTEGAAADPGAIEPPSPPPPPPAVTARLKGRATRVGPRFSIDNDNTFRWTNCDVRLPSNKRYLMNHLEAGDHEAIMIMRFAQDGIQRDLPDSILTVTCDQGVGKFPL